MNFWLSVRCYVLFLYRGGDKSTGGCYIGKQKEREAQQDGLVLSIISPHYKKDEKMISD